MAYESFRRWQFASIEQKQRSSALMMGLSGAGLGLLFSELSGAAGFVGCWASFLAQLSGFLLMLTMGFGAAFSMNRVRDFDLTSQIARRRKNKPESTSLSAMREKVRGYGRITRRLYAAQIGCFLFGSVGFVVFMMLRVWGVLYR